MNFADCVLKLCAESDVPVFFEPTDPRKGAKALKSPWTKAIKYTSPNIHELCNMVGQEINASNLLNGCDALGRNLMRQMPGAAAIIITLGEHGVLLIERLISNSSLIYSIGLSHTDNIRIGMVYL